MKTGILSHWSKLSETLPGQTPGQCQNCAAPDPSAGIPVPLHERLGQLTYWQEHDENDSPVRAFVVLCKSCADKLIEPHERLYRETSAYTPMPGAMPICVDCRHRERLDCRSPVAMFNGGPGLEYEPKGSMVHVCRSPRRLSGWMYLAQGPVEKCSGKETAET